MELEKIKKLIENNKKELEDLRQDYGVIYKQVEEQLQKEIKLLIETNLQLETQINIKMRCLQRYRLDFDIEFTYEDNKSYGTAIECRYYICDYAIVNPTKSDIKLYINYACRQVYRNDIGGLECIKVLGLLANNFDFVENNLWFLVSKKEFVELDNKIKLAELALQQLEFDLKQQEIKEIKDKIKVGNYFKHKDLIYHFYKIVKITNKYIYYEDYLNVNKSKLQLASNTPYKIKIDDFIRCVKWDYYYFIENLDF